MGLFDKFRSGVDKAYDGWVDVNNPLDRGLQRADKVAGGGIPAPGRIVGIRRTSSDNTDSRDLTIEVLTPDGPQRVGVQLGTGAIERVRLGVEVPMLGDGTGRFVLDASTISQLGGLHGLYSAFGQRMVKPFDDGVVDKGLDARVQRRLKKGVAARCVVTSVAQKLLMGMTTTTWTITGQVEGFGEATSADEVPFYGSWWAAPQVDLAVAIDANKPGKMTIDWPAVSIERVPHAGTILDPPLAGGVVEQLEARRAETPPTSTMSVGGEIDLTPVAGSDSAIEGVTIEMWARVEVGTGRDRIPPKDYDTYAVAYGVPPGRFTAIAAEWQKRAASDWRIGAKLGEAVEAERKRKR